MKPPRAPLFLERGSYRRRRLTDAARVLPFLGVFLFLLPLIWREGSSTAKGMIYLFSAWGVLIALAWAMSRPLSRVLQLEEGRGEASAEDPAARDAGEDGA
ncbi:hypothetical protein SAMN05216257_102572 [Meinhardsimonia xiamenensis]|jgi:hypothetical protein|uniref:Transmembrane protein n=1 Tax=Meinhardsimonia xiamenensis TaxID=990712 RepID=A0A1G9BJQ7_9RHOB|nr:hypothetical protein [Meinhardsimonia xiamenensis]PRX34954.1 hypothetical protein LV81_01547 [Meinhardsimonia xiamenensis]SDK39701.1 hypothetical protein SAMN05216257_102572 [Meinhardsimonia xiamenensis]